MSQNNLPKSPPSLEEINDAWHKKFEELRSNPDIDYFKRMEFMSVEELIRDPNKNHILFQVMVSFLQHKGYYWCLPHIRKNTNDAIVFNYFFAKNRDVYKSTSNGNLWFSGAFLYSYNEPIAVRCKNGFLVNLSKYSVTTDIHIGYALSDAPYPRGYAPFRALHQFIAFEELLQEVEIIDSIDTKRESLLKYRNVYLLSTYDVLANGRVRMYVIEVPEPAKTVAEAYRIISGLSGLEFNKYMAGIIKRQGEFFFVPIGDSREVCKRFSVRGLNVVKKVDISKIFHDGQRNPHVATEATFLGGFLLVRGTVRHPEHKMVRLGKMWHEVRKNRVGLVAQDSFLPASD